ncbi:MAG: PIN domain-containing protein [Thaumarchaeota archaeon]|nr:PIN domain-containing protein [Nitrososphaerota archaeon]
MDEQRIYLDTSILLPFMDPNAPKDEKKHSKSVLYDAARLKDRHNFKVIVPQIVLGELFLKLETISHEVIGAFDEVRRLVDEYPAVTTEIAKLALRLAEIDYFLKIEFNDALIIAHALNDVYSRYFITTESKILRSSELVEQATKLQHEGLRKVHLTITDSLKRKG